MQYVWILVFLSITLVFLLPQNAEATEWYSGINLKEGDFFRYQLCSIDFNLPLIDCQQFEMIFLIKEKIDDFLVEPSGILDWRSDVWNVQVLVLHDDKTITGDMQIGRIAPDPVSSSDNITPYRYAFKSSINYLSKYSNANYIRTLDQMPWYPLAQIGGLPITSSGKQSITTPAGKFDAWVLTTKSERHDIKIWLNEELPFPVKGIFIRTYDNGKKITEWEYEMLEHKEFFDKNLSVPETIQDILSNLDKSQLTIDPPLKQMKNDIDPNEVICNEGLQLIFKSTDGSPACVKPKTAEKLIERGWAVATSQMEFTTISGSQLVPWTIDYGVKTSSLIVYGEIVSVETKNVDKSYTSPYEYEEEKRFQYQAIVPYQYITIKAENYLLDRTGQYSDFVTFRDRGEGPAIINGKNTFIKIEYFTSYSVGEKGLFYLYEIEGELETIGVIGKFAYDWNTGKFQSEIFERKGISPLDLSEHKIRVDSALAIEDT